MKKILVCIVLVFSHYLSGMQAPLPETKKESEQPAERTIDSSIATKFGQEESKFRRYDLDHPQKFLERLRRVLNKDDNPVTYLANLNQFASYLLLQDMLIKALAKSVYLYKKYKVFTTEMNETKQKIESEETTGVDTSQYFVLAPKSEEDLTEVLAHSEIIKGDAAGMVPNTAATRKSISTLILDPNKSEWAHNLGKNRKAALIMGLIYPLMNQRNSLVLAYQRDISPISLLKDKTKKFTLLDENIQYLINFYDLYERRAQQVKAHKLKQDEYFKVSEREKDFLKEQQKVIDLYIETQPWYRQLYEVVRKEMDEVLQNLRAKDLKAYLAELKNLKTSTTFETLASAQLLPAGLPVTLDIIVRPSDNDLGSVNDQLLQIEKEFEQAKTEWNKKAVEIAAQPPLPVKKKRYRRRTEVGAPEAKEKAPEEPGEKEVKKLKEDRRDGSFIAEGDETDKLITINNPKNDTQEIIYKTDKPYQIKEKLPALNYTKSIHMWFDDPEKARETQGYNDPKSRKYRAGEEKWKPIVLHAFSRLIDDYILQWGTKLDVPSRIEAGKKDWLISIPGAIEFPDGTKETGVFAYLIDSKTGDWYHRMFEPQSSKKLIGDLTSIGAFSPEMKGYYDVYFPPVGM